MPPQRGQPVLHADLPAEDRFEVSPCCPSKEGPKAPDSQYILNMASDQGQNTIEMRDRKIMPTPNRMINYRSCSMNPTFRDDFFSSYFPSKH
jgi:hypothetical protein